MKVNKKALGITVITIVIAVACLAMLLIGISKESTKVYKVNGFQIELPNNFIEKEQVSFTTYLESPRAMATALKEDFTTLESVGITKDSSLDEYIQAVISANGFKDTDIKDISGTDYKYFTYESSASNKDFYYMAVILKSDDAFWLINFACETKNKEEFQDRFIKWAKTIKVD